MSFAVRNGICAVVISSDGVIRQKYAEKVKDKVALSNSYTAIMYAFDLAMRLVRQYIQENENSDEITFELSNSTFKKWVDRFYSKDDYCEEFSRRMHVLQSLPIRYNFSYSSKPKAYFYADLDNCKGIKLGGLL